MLLSDITTQTEFNNALSNNTYVCIYIHNGNEQHLERTEEVYTTILNSGGLSSDFNFYKLDRKYNLTTDRMNPSFIIYENNIKITTIRGPNYNYLMKRLKDVLSVGFVQVSSPYGTYHQEISNDTETLNDTTTFVTKTSLTTSTIPHGKYRIGWYYNWRQEGKNADIIVEIVQGTDNVMMHQEEPQDRSSNQSISVSGFRYITLTEGSYTFDLRFKSSESGADAYMHNARMELWLIEL